jgi:hypothetical protein
LNNGLSLAISPSTNILAASSSSVVSKTVELYHITSGKKLDCPALDNKKAFSHDVRNLIFYEGEDGETVLGITAGSSLLAYSMREGGTLWNDEIPTK